MTRLLAPRGHAMVDDNGRPTVPYQRFMDEMARRIGSTEDDLGNINVVTIPKPEDYGAVGDGVTDDTAALQEFFNNPYKFGRLTAGATYLIDADTVVIPRNTRWWGPRSATVRNATVAGATLIIDDDDVELRGFTINGGNPSSTIASGFRASHRGVFVSGTSSDLVTDIRLIDLAVLNVGDAGLELFHTSRAIVQGCNITRCGYVGVIVANSTNVWVDQNVITNIYPGDIPGDPGTNCYGVTATRYLASSVRPAGIWITRNTISGIMWEGIDEHDAIDTWICDNYITDVGQGVVVQHDENGYAARRITVTGNDITGFGATKVIEGVTYRPTGGIICVGGNGTNIDSGGQGQNLTVANNIVNNCGDNRTVPTGGGITLRHWRDFKVIGNSLFACYRNGIISDDDTNSRSEYGVIANNLIDGVISVGGVAQDIRVGPFCAALVIGNFSAGGGNGFSQAAAPTLVTTFTSNLEFS